MKAVLVLCLVILTAACGGSPTGPSTLPPGPSAPGNPAAVPTPQPTPQPAPPTSSAVMITPEGAVIPTGATMVFTASGGDHRNYVLTAGPASQIQAEQTTFNQISVQVFDKGSGVGWVHVKAYDGSKWVEKQISVVFK